MRTTIDSAGRIVVPKAIRDAVGLTGGESVEITDRDGCIEIDIRPTPMRLKRRGKGVVATPGKKLPVLKASQVREVLESTRR